jgi:hypothetical protein
LALVRDGAKAEADFVGESVRGMAERLAAAETRAEEAAGSEAAARAALAAATTEAATAVAAAEEVRPHPPFESLL